jgi:hypothetical protein
MPEGTSENPFCTRRIRPGVIAFLFPPGQDVETLLERLRSGGWQGEIVGPHGSGKSALLATLIPALERAGQRVTLVELHDGQRRLPTKSMEPLLGRHESPPRPSPGILVVDGYEQLARWRRWLLRRRCRRRRLGFIVTAHASVGLPLLWQTSVTPELAQRIVAQLTVGLAPLLAPSELSECLARHHGDMRETLFSLYDRYEESRSHGRQPLVRSPSD